MGVYPIVVDLDGRSCVVIGGGAVAERRVGGLLAAGAALTVVSPRLTPGLAALAAAGRIRHVARPYRPGDLAGAALAFAATGTDDVSEAVAREARALGIWVNAADDPARCDFLLPAVLRRGALTVAVSSGGVSPALTRAVRDHLAAALPPAWAELTELAGEVRRVLRGGGRSPDGEAWRRALASDLVPLVAEGRRDEARRRLLERLESGS